MKYFVPACAAALTAGALFATMSVAFAQNSPGVPGGILNDEFRLNEHPQMPFGASAPSKKGRGKKRIERVALPIPPGLAIRLQAEAQGRADDQPQPQEGRQPGVLEVAVQAGRSVEEGVLEDVRGVDPALKPSIHAQLDHATQPVAVALEQVGQRLAVASAEPLEEIVGITGIVRHGSPYP